MAQQNVSRNASRQKRYTEETIGDHERLSDG